MTAGAMPRGECPVCGGDVAMSRFGEALRHNTRRISGRGRPYRASDVCEGSGQRCVMPERA